MAGISPGLLRAWERRYGLVEPRRTASGYRVYSQEDVERLSAAARLVSAGHSISEVARLSPDDLREAARQVGAAPAPRGGVAGGELSRPAVEAAILGALEATARFDRERFEEALLPVLGLGALSPAAACDEVLMPLMRAIGDAWERGVLSVAAEHFGSALVRAKILNYLQFLSRPGQGPRLVCACPDDERHEGGLLAFSVHAAASGWDVVYLGATTPVAEAIETAVRVGAEVLALSLTNDSDRVPTLMTALASLAGAPDGPRILVGGRAAVARRAELERLGLIVAEHARLALDDLHLDGLAKKPAR